MRGRSRICALLFCVLSALIALAQKPRSTTPLAKPNVILITIDTVRADHLGCYGYSKIHTPVLDGLARDGILFEHSIAQVPLTWPSHTAILTGTYPFQNGVQDFTGQPLDPRFRTISQAFKSNGYDTGAVVSAFVLDRSWGLVRGFDFYDDAFSPEALQTKDPGLVDRKAEASVTRAIAWLKKTQHKTPRRPFFLWLHLYDPHSPYDPPEPYRTEYRDHLYDGEIAYADHELGRMIAWLKSTQQYARTLIVASSDHGESLGEHGEQEHGFFLYNPSVHVPLIVKPPAGRGGKNGRVSDSVETISIAPTLLHLAGVKDTIEAQFSAPGLFDKKGDSSAASYSETFYPFSSFGWSPLHSLQIGQYRYVDAPRAELYDESTDPEELHDIVAQQPATAAVLKEKLKALLLTKPYAPSSQGLLPLTLESQDKLRALGYVAYRSPVSAETLATGLADPKDKIAEFNTILSAQDAFRLGHFSDAEQLLAKVQQQDPKMYILPFMAGEAAARRQDWETSAREFQKCLELNPNFDQAMTGLASALSFLGKSDDARHWIDKGLKINPENYRAHYQLASMEARTDPVAAIADYKRSIAIQGNFALSRRDLGMLYYEQKDYQAAAPQLAKAVELGMKDPRLLNFLGVCYERTARYQDAIKTYQRALQIDNSLAEAHLNLGFAYDQVRHKALAAREYQRACELKPAFCELIKNKTEQQKKQ